MFTLTMFTKKHEDAQQVQDNIIRAINSKKILINPIVPLNNLYPDLQSKFDIMIGEKSEHDIDIQVNADDPDDDMCGKYYFINNGIIAPPGGSNIDNTNAIELIIEESKE